MEFAGIYVEFYRLSEKKNIWFLKVRSALELPSIILKQITDAR